jgi:hypothetical protein
MIDMIIATLIAAGIVIVTAIIAAIISFMGPRP